MAAASNTGVPYVCEGSFRIPQLGLGCSLFHNKLGQDREIELFKKAIDIGYRYFDTSPFYGTERSIGRAVQEKINEGVIRREDLFIVSKLPYWAHKTEHVKKAVNRTLEELGMEYVDLYLIHLPVSYEPTIELDEPLPLDEIWSRISMNEITFTDVDIVLTYKALEKFVEDGLLKNLGLSNVNSKQIQRIIENCKIKPTNIQVEIHPLLTNERLVCFCHSLGLTVTAYNLLGNKSHEESNFVVPTEREEIKVIARKHKKSAAQILIRFQIQRNIVAIPRTSRIERLKENISVFDFELDDKDMETILKMNENLRTRIYVGFGKQKEYPFHEPF